MAFANKQLVKAEISSSVSEPVYVQQSDLEHTIDEVAVAGLPENMEPYDDGTYRYECYYIQATSLSSSIHRVKRIRKADGQVRWAGGLPFTPPNYGYNQPATNTATVAALSYS